MMVLFSCFHVQCCFPSEENLGKPEHDVMKNEHCFSAPKVVSSLNQLQLVSLSSIHSFFFIEVAAFYTDA